VSLTVPGLIHRHLPAAQPSGKLLVVLHGRGDSMDGFSWLPGELDLPGFGYLFVNAPDDYFGGYSWYDLPPNQAPGVLRSRALLFGALDALAEQGVASRDVVLFGFSQGCLMGIDVGLRYPRPLGGVCGVSGYMMFEDRVAAEVQPHAKRMPWLLTHGTQDAVVPIGPTRAHVAALREAGVEVDWHEFAKAHTIEPTAEWPLIRRWMQARLAER
jgi:phospholipase/carboxylesterase